MDLTTYTPVRRFPANTVGKDYFVTDVHGCFDILNAFLTHVEFDSSVDRLYCGGDLIDRGTKSLECAMLIYQDWFFTVKGNHEQMGIDASFGPYEDDLWIMNGGRWAYQEDRDEMRKLFKDMATLPYIITVGEGAERFNIVHAELTFDIDITDAKLDAFDVVQTRSMYIGEPAIWGRDIIQGHPAPHDVDNLSITYCGHTPVAEPVIIGKQMYLDGGAVFGRKMQLVCHTTQTLHTYDVATATYSSVPLSNVPTFG